MQVKLQNKYGAFWVARSGAVFLAGKIPGFAQVLVEMVSFLPTLHNLFS